MFVCFEKVKDDFFDIAKNCFSVFVAVNDVAVVVKCFGDFKVFFSHL